jgi:hypothetical protein
MSLLVFDPNKKLKASHTTVPLNDLSVKHGRKGESSLVVDMSWGGWIR